MLTLMMLRHAKAEAAQHGDDRARALTAKGRADAARLAAYCASERLDFDEALVSAAVRTRQTAEIVVQGLGRAITFAADDDLYNATAAALLERISGVESDRRNLLVVGHNPGIMDASARLARCGDLRDLHRLQNRFAPCTLAVIRFESETWQEACASGGRLDDLVTPEDLAPAD